METGSWDVQLVKHEPNLGKVDSKPMGLGPYKTGNLSIYPHRETVEGRVNVTFHELRNYHELRKA